MNAVAALPAIPLDAVIAQALERKTLHCVGDTVFIRRSGHAVIRQEVIAVCVYLGTENICHLHYVVAPCKGDKVAKVINRSVYPSTCVFATAQEAFEAKEPTERTDDPLNSDIERAVVNHRKHFNLPSGNAA